MPGRKRMRLLAGVLIAIVVIVVYTRRAPVESYRDYVRQQMVGGGAVLRGKNPVAQQPAEVLPETLSHSTAPAPTTSVKSTQRQSTSPTSTRAPDRTTAARTSTAPSPSPTSTIVTEPLYNQAIPMADDEDDLPAEFGQGRVEVDVKSSTTSALHWSMQPEHFPISTTIQLPTGSSVPMPRIQYAGKNAGGADKERLAIIKAATEHAWNGYRSVAFGADEVKPVSGKVNNPFNGWGATLVDSLDTLYLMGMMEEFEEAVEHVRKIDFTTSARADIPLFETTIRYLGGLVAAYDISDAKYPILLAKAVELAEVLYSAFDTPNRMPQTFYYWKPAFASQPHRAGNRVVLAELGSLSVEFTRLAQLTGEPKYYDAIARISDALEAWQNNTRIPGMWPISVDASGCHKPAQVAHTPTVITGPQMPVPGGDGNIMHAGEPVKQGAGNRALLAAQDRAAADREENLAAQKQKAAQKALDDEFFDRRSRIGKIIGDNDPIPEGGLDGISKAQIERDRAMASHRAQVEAQVPGKMDYYEKMGLYQDLGAPKVKRQLGPDTGKSSSPEQQHEVATHSNSNSTAHKQELRTPPAVDTRTGQDVCIPQGLASTSKYGQETFTLGGQSDSTYEYLPKEYMLLGGLVDQYRSMYIASADAAIENLLFRPMTIDELDILISGQLRVHINRTDDSSILTFEPTSEHLTCFAGGMFAMGGKLFNRPEDVEIGRKLTDGCIWAYNVTTTGIMPEVFTAMECDDVDVCEWNQTAYWHELDPYEESRTRQRSTGNVGDGPTILTVMAPSSTAGIATSTSSLAAATSTKAADDAVLQKRQLQELTETDFDLAKPLAPVVNPALSSSTGSHNKPALPTLSSAKAVYTPKPPLSHQEFVQKKIEDERLPPGIVKMSSRKYILRPEAIESVFYMYRITGEQYWRDMGWKMFTAIDEHTQALYGNGAIDDVTKMAPEVKDNMESFWIAETLKYFYLLFDDVERYSLDEWVLNTEAHFFKRPKYKFAA